MKSLILLITCLLMIAGCYNSNTNLSSKTRIAIGFKDDIYKYVFVDTSGYFKARDFDGIGNFKIGKTTILIIKDMEGNLKTRARKVNDSSDEYFWIGGSKILQLMPNPSHDYSNPSKISYCPDVKIFKIESYNISSIELENLYLTFYRDTLVELKCDENEKIAKAMEYKYGKGTEINESFTFRCGFNRVLSSGHANIVLWQNENILSELYKSYRYCGDHQFDYFFKIFTKSKAFNLINNCDTINRRIFINKAKKEEKDKMKNF